MAGVRELSTTLNIEDLNTVLSKLNHLSKSKWRSFGLKAGLYEPTLTDIEANHPTNVERCFNETVSRWLKRRDGVDKEGVPTWPRLGDILQRMGERDLAVKITKQGGPAKSGKHGKLRNEYSKMNDRFSFILNKFAEEIIKKNLLDKFKGFLLGRSLSQSEGRERDEDEITDVCNKFQLIRLLRKYFFLSNFGALTSFAEEYELITSKILLDFSREVDDLYSKILAKDFAQQAIEDYERKKYYGEVVFKVVWDLDTTLQEFQKFLAKAFHRHGILISLRVIHYSLLNFDVLYRNGW